ncbi:MAG: AGE family epimerase/isomerase [Deltaproteobacteria bacterium]|nr:AGE family epimerase/isomerase [Deltaproteobacteria bacterium]
MRRWAWLLALPLVAACSGGSEPSADAGFTDDAGADAGVVDTGVAAGSYAHVAPTLGAVPEVLKGETWLTHHTQDILPYWDMPEAFGTPEGNFPTYRGMNGTIQGSNERRPRMIARQTFAYAVAYMLHGDPRHLELAHAGAQWIMDHAADARGGFHARLSAAGDPNGTDAKTAQDTAYCMLGLGAYFFVTRDPAAEAVIVETRDLLFSDVFFDQTFGRIRDAVSDDLSAEVDVEGDGGWELVAQLDPINAFLLLTQPVLTEASRRQQFQGDLQRLAQLMIDRFWKDGLFWGVHNKQGQYRSKHADFGHTLKAYWMVLQIDKRLPEHPFYGFLQENVHGQVALAYDDTYGRWAKRPISPSQVEYGSDWWIYAEEDQIAATLNMIDGQYSDELERTAQHWLDEYVDHLNGSPGEVIPGITRTGNRGYNWSPTDTAKCNEWKSGYHSSEHALVLYLTGRYLEDAQATLHFAVPPVDAQAFTARPYIFDGEIAGRTTGSTLSVGGRDLVDVAVSFSGLY